MGNLSLAQFEARIRFETDAQLPDWSGNALRSGLGARLKDMVCVNPMGNGQPGFVNCWDECPHIEMCVYHRLFSSRRPKTARVLKSLSEIPNPFALTPPASGRYETGHGAVLGFTLFGAAIQTLPYFVLALRNLGESGLGSRHKAGQGRFQMELIDSLAPGKRENVYYGDTVYNRAQIVTYREILERSQDHSGKLKIRFFTPTQIKENDRFTSRPSFRGLMSKLLSRANVLAEFHGDGMLYDKEDALRILGQCRGVEMAEARTRKVHHRRYFHDQRKKEWLPAFFTGEIAYHGEFSRDVMALLKLGEMIHVGKMATFGNGRYVVELKI